MVNIFNDKRTSNTLLAAIHFCNLLWIVRIFWLRYESVAYEVNYLADITLLNLILICIILHVARWKILSNDSECVIYTSGFALKIKLRNVAILFYGQVPYLVSPVPSDALIENRAIEHISIHQSYTPTTVRELFLFLLGIKNLKLIYFACVLLFAFSLYAGGLGRFTSLLGSFWIAVPLLMCGSAGLLIYFSATLLFVLFFGNLRI